MAALHERFQEARIDGSEWFTGPNVGPLLSFINQLATRVVAAYQLNGYVPDWRSLEPWASDGSRLRVRFTEPSPKPTPEEIERLKLIEQARKEEVSYVPTIAQSGCRGDHIFARVNPHRERRAALSQ